MEDTTSPPQMTTTKRIKSRIALVVMVILRSY